MASEITHKNAQLILRHDSVEGSVSCTGQRFLVSPENRAPWDLVIGFAVIYVCIKVPYSLAFDDPSLEKPAWVNFELVLDFVFWADICLNFRTMYIQKGILVSNPSKIALHYLLTWFPLDLVASFPFESVMVVDKKARKTIKLWKVVKLTKLLRMGRIIKFLMQYAKYSNLLQLVFVFVFIAHWSTCLLFAAEFGASRDLRAVADASLLPLYALYVSRLNAVVQALSGVGLPSAAVNFFASDTATLLWSESGGAPGGLVNSSSLSLGAIGVGEVDISEEGAVILDVAHDTAARLVDIVLSITGALFVAFLTSMVHQAAARRASPRLLYETRRATLVTEMKKSRLTKDLQDRIKAFYEYQWVHGSKEGEHPLLTDQYLSSALKREIALELAKDYAPFRSNDMFRDADALVLAAVVRRLRSQIFLIGDYVAARGSAAQEVFFVQSGTVGVMGGECDDVLLSLLSGGESFGEVALLTESPRLNAVRALSLAELNVLTREALAAVYDEFPSYARSMRLLAAQILADDLQRLFYTTGSQPDEMADQLLKIAASDPGLLWSDDRLRQSVKQILFRRCDASPTAAANVLRLPLGMRGAVQFLRSELGIDRVVAVVGKVRRRFEWMERGRKAKAFGRWLRKVYAPLGRRSSVGCRERTGGSSGGSDGGDAEGWGDQEEGDEYGGEESDDDGGDDSDAGWHDGPSADRGLHAVGLPPVASSLHAGAATAAHDIRSRASSTGHADTARAAAAVAGRRRGVGFLHRKPPRRAGRGRGGGDSALSAAVADLAAMQRSQAALLLRLASHVQLPPPPAAAATAETVSVSAEAAASPQSWCGGKGGSGLSCDVAANDCRQSSMPSVTRGRSRRPTAVLGTVAAASVGDGEPAGCSSSEPMAGPPILSEGSLVDDDDHAPAIADCHAGSGGGGTAAPCTAGATVTEAGGGGAADSSSGSSGDGDGDGDEGLDSLMSLLHQRGVAVHETSDLATLSTMRRLRDPTEAAGRGLSSRPVVTDLLPAAAAAAAVAGGAEGAPVINFAKAMRHGSRRRSSHDVSSDVASLVLHAKHGSVDAAPALQAKAAPAPVTKNMFSGFGRRVLNTLRAVGSSDTGGGGRERGGSSTSVVSKIYAVSVEGSGNYEEEAKEEGAFTRMGVSGGECERGGSGVGGGGSSGSSASEAQVQFPPWQPASAANGPPNAGGVVLEVVEEMVAKPKKSAVLPQRVSVLRRGSVRLEDAEGEESIGEDGSHFGD